MHTITIKNNKSTPLIAGHPWVFSGALAKIYKDINPGEIVEVCNEAGILLAGGFYNYKKSIAFRALYFGKSTQFNYDFLYAKINSIYNNKKQYYGNFNTTGFRLVNADADYLPGLVIDVYDDTAVFSIAVLGMEAFIADIVKVLTKIGFNYIVEKSTSNSRKQEDLPQKPVIVHHNKNSYGNVVEFLENNMTMVADVIGGQKTGYFLDQRAVRSWVKDNCHNKGVINLFSYSGAFSIACLNGGAKHVTSVDISAASLKLLQDNLQKNYKHLIDKHQCVEEDVFKFLERHHNGLDCDILICDPPAFAKNQASLKNAIAGYTQLNKMCMQQLKTGDIFITSSCSGLIKTDEFIDIIKKSAFMAKQKLMILKIFTEDADHTSLLGFREGNYLKTLVLQVV